MSKIVWLTGSRGFVGSYIREALIEAGYTVKCLSNTAGQDENIINADFSDRNKLRKIIDEHGTPDTLIHLGWGNTNDPHHKNHITSNVNEGINLFDEMYNSGVQRIIFMGSASEYGSQVGLLKENFPSQEEGLNHYIKGKRTLGTHGLQSAKEGKGIFIYVRLFYTYGAGQKTNSLINQLFQCSLGNEIMQLSPCEHFRDYIHVSDVAEGVKKLLNVDESGVVNLGSGKAIQLKEFVKLFWKELGAAPNQLKFGAHDQPAHEQSQPKSFADISKLKKLTNWSPTTSIEEGIRLTVQKMKLGSIL
jgi:nucleoside-diphosphate-sugar epimerase